jgi:CubicO group peptidase (beta-lactamase class C family)
VPLLLAAATDGKLELDEPAHHAIPGWTDDPQRRRITFAHLGSHSSGMPDVPFDKAGGISSGQIVDPDFPAWMVEYFENPARRFRLAVERTPILFDPGSRFNYSGAGFYALAFAMAGILGESGDNAEDYFRTRLARPLGIPDSDWRLSYGQVHRIDKQEYVALGSGANITGRALARIGQLLMDGGRWQGSELLREDLVRRATSNSGLPPPVNGVGLKEPSVGIGWWVNDPPFFPDLPRDAAISAGAGHRIVLIVPSWKLVAVRLGRSLGRAAWEGSFWEDLERELLQPLAAAVQSPSQTLEAGGRGEAGGLH